MNALLLGLLFFSIFCIAGDREGDLPWRAAITILLIAFAAEVLYIFYELGASPQQRWKPLFVNAVGGAAAGILSAAILREYIRRKDKRAR